MVNPSSKHFRSTSHTEFGWESLSLYHRLSEHQHNVLSIHLQSKMRQHTKESSLLLFLSFLFLPYNEQLLYQLSQPRAIVSKLSETYHVNTTAINKIKWWCIMILKRILHKFPLELVLSIVFLLTQIINFIVSFVAFLKELLYLCY